MLRRYLIKFQRVIQIPSVMVVSFVISVIGYALFIQEKFIPPKITKDTIINDLVFTTDSYTVTAERAVEKGGKRTLFGFSLEQDGRFVQSGVANVDNEDHLKFAKGVRGANEDWKFRSQEAEYKKRDDESIVFLSGDVEAINENRGILLNTDHLKFQQSSGLIDMRGDVRIEEDGNTLKGDYAKYNELDGRLLMRGNVFVDFKRDGLDSSLDMSMDSLEYDISKNIAESSGDFRLFVSDLKVKGRGFIFEEDNFLARKAVEIHSDDGILHSDLFEFVGNTLFMTNVRGRLNGKDIEADFMEYSKEKSRLEGSVVLVEDGKKVSSDSVDIDGDDVAFLGDVSIEAEETEILTDRIDYNRESKNALIKTGNIISDTSNFVAENIKFNVESREGSLENAKGIIKDIDAEIDSVEFSLEDSRYVLTNLRGKDDGIEIIAPNIEGKDGIFNIPFLTLSPTDDTKIEITNAVYNKETSTLRSEDMVLGRSKSTTFETKGIEFNTDTREGRSFGELIVKGDQLEMRSSSLEIDGRVLRLKDVNGKHKDISFSSERGEYREGIGLSLIDSVRLEGEVADINSERVTLNVEDNVLIFDKDTYFIKDDALVVIESGKFNISTENLEANNLVIIRENDDIIKAGRAILERELKLISASNGVRIDLKKGADITADYGRIFYILNEDGEEELTRAELNGNTYFKDDKLNIESGFMEYSKVRKDDRALLYIRDDLKIRLSGAGSDSAMSSDFAVYDIDKELGILRGNVEITIRNVDLGTINAVADEAIYNIVKRIINLSQNVDITGTKNNIKVTGDDVKVDITTGRVLSEGRAGFSYNLNSSSGQEDNDIAKEFDKDIKAAREISKQFI